MSKETFEQPYAADPGLLEPVDNRVPHEPPPEFYTASSPEFYTASAKEQKAEVESRLEPLRDAIREFEKQQLPVPPGLAAAYERLLEQHKKFAKQPGSGKQIELFSGEREAEQPPTARAA